MSEHILKALEELRVRFSGYHVTIQLYPSGGMIELEGCEECGTDPDFFNNAGWRTNRKGRSFEQALSRLEASFNEEGSEKE